MPTAERSSRPRDVRSLRPWIAVGGAALLAVIAIAALYSTSSLDEAPPATPPIPAGPQPYIPAYASLRTDNPQETDANGQPTRWLARRGTVGIGAGKPGDYWLSFKSLSLRRPRLVRFRASDGQTRTQMVAGREGPYVVGPFKLAQNLTLRVTAEPGPQRASKLDKRKIAVRLGSLRASPRPYGLFPEAGFYPDEVEAPSRFNWLNREGDMRIAAPESASQGWLRFSVSSVDAPRRLRVRAGSVREVIEVPGAPGFKQVVVGPIPFRDGRAIVQFRSVEPTSTFGGDQRRLSVQIRNAEVFGTRPG